MGLLVRGGLRMENFRRRFLGKASDFFDEMVLVEKATFVGQFGQIKMVNPDLQAIIKSNDPCIELGRNAHAFLKKPLHLFITEIIGPT